MRLSLFLTVVFIMASCKLSNKSNQLKAQSLADQRPIFVFEDDHYSYQCVLSSSKELNLISQNTKNFSSPSDICSNGLWDLLRIEKTKISSPPSEKEVNLFLEISSYYISRLNNRNLPIGSYSSSFYDSSNHYNSSYYDSSNHYNSSYYDSSNYYNSSYYDSSNYYNSSYYDSSNHYNSSYYDSSNHYNSSYYDSSNHYNSSYYDSSNHYNSSYYDSSNFSAINNPNVLEFEIYIRSTGEWDSLTDLRNRLN